MRVLVIGSGGREHALVYKLAQSRMVKKLFCAPGNPGINAIAESVPLKAAEIEALAQFAAREKIDLTVVGPEQPLAGGIADLFESRGLALFGPTKQASELEWSKAFAKGFMARHRIPTAAYRTFTREQRAEAREYLARSPLPVVLKADGLAAGKGVIICESRDTANAALEEMFSGTSFGEAGGTVVVEEFLDGVEASVFAVCDGKDFVTLASAQDHKRACDGDRGKNTGGMGAYAPARMITADILKTVSETIVAPTLRGMAAEGRPYRGCLYVGLMLTKEGSKVVEYNCRFGDPETQVVLPLYDADLLELLLAAATGKLWTLRVPPSRTAKGSAVCVVMASGGYPDGYQTGYEIRGIEEAEQLPGIVVFHAGTRMDGEKIVTAGGRVLGVTALGGEGSLREVIRAAYAAAGLISFEGMHYRSDIGQKASASAGE